MNGFKQLFVIGESSVYFIIGGYGLTVITQQFLNSKRETLNSEIL